MGEEYKIGPRPSKVGMLSITKIIRTKCTEKKMVYINTESAGFSALLGTDLLSVGLYPTIMRIDMPLLEAL